MCIYEDDTHSPGKKRTRGLCSKHYARWLKYGDCAANKLPQRSDAPVSEKLTLIGWTVTDSGCWEWAGSRTQGGYGRLGGVKTHRLAYEAWVGPIGEGLVVRHKCDNPPCINPEHLETGTHKDNMQDMYARNRNRSGTQRLTPKDVTFIREQYWDCGVSIVDLSNNMAISLSHTTRIVTGAKYPDIAGPIGTLDPRKLSWGDVSYIRSIGTGETNKDLASKFGVDPSIISKVKHGHRWKQE